LNPTINFKTKNERGNSIGGTEKKGMESLRGKPHPQGSLLFQANPLIPDPA